MDAARIVELFEAFAPVRVRRMFGGFGIYRDDVMFALVADDLIYLKAHAESQAAFEREGCGPFVYAAKGGRKTVMSYWRMPDRLYDDPAELSQWAKAAHGAAVRAAAKKRPAPKRRAAKKIARR